MFKISSLKANPSYYERILFSTSEPHMGVRNEK